MPSDIASGTSERGKRAALGDRRVFFFTWGRKSPEAGIYWPDRGWSLGSLSTRLTSMLLSFLVNVSGSLGLANAGDHLSRLY
jgi:hypothetical protein